MGRTFTKKTAWVNSPQADEVAEYYTQGHSVKETAERFGVSKGQVNNLARERGLTNGKNWREARIEKQKTDAVKSLEKLLNDKGFFYCGGYTDKKSKVKILCKTCGLEYERSVQHIQTGNLVCRNCQHVQALERQEHKKIVARQNAEMRALERKWARLLKPPKNYYENTHEAFLNRKGICEICGKEYTVRDYVKSTGAKKASDNGVCSIECREEKARRIKRKYRTPGNHRHRAKMYGVPYEPGITIRKLVKRDGLTCALCGGICDWNDRGYGEYCGPTYPTIDHIIPLAKGGGHVWSNVQVAHHRCNSLKSDSIEVEARKAVQNGNN